MATSNALNPRNPHRGRYEFDRLCKAWPELAAYLQENPSGDRSIDFSDAAAVRCLNAALLKAYYGVTWNLPEPHLCPPIPGRADYIHYLADCLAALDDVSADDVRALDIGTGASCIYPVLAHCSYGWRFVASDIDATSLAVAAENLTENPKLDRAIELRLQPNKSLIFENIIQAGEHFDLCLCNPPFFASAEEAQKANRRKRQNLHGSKAGKAAKFNFSGTQAELWCKGGEPAFLKKMAKQSVDYAQQVRLFSCLVSRSENVKPLVKLMNKLGAVSVEVVPMQQGQKQSRFVAWRY